MSNDPNRCECVTCADCQGRGKLTYGDDEDVDYCEACHNTGMAFMCGWCCDDSGDEVRT